MRRFLCVTLSGYIVALLAIGGAVWFSSMPILNEMSRDALEAHAETKAGAVEERVAAKVGRVRDLARYPATIAFVTGDRSAEGQMRRVVRELLRDDARQVRVVDFEGNALSEWQTTGAIADLAPQGSQAASATGFAPGTWHRIGLFPDATEVASRVYVEMSGPAHGRALVAVPVLDRGYFEGAVIVETRLDFKSIFAVEAGSPQPQLLAHGFNTSPPSAAVGAFVSEAVAGTNLTLSLPNDFQVLETRGWTLLRRVMLVALLGLALPFAGMAILGRGAISAPYEQLLESRRTLEMRTREASELAQIVEGCHDAITITDRQGRVVFVNEAFELLTGYTLAECRGRVPGRLLQGPDTDPETVAALAGAISRGEPVRVELLNYRRDGSSYWIMLSVFPIRSRDGELVRFAALSSDITAERQAQSHLEKARRQTEYLAHHDELTGLPNRRAIDSLLQREIGTDTAPRTIVRIDLDHFKSVNDTHGHAAGDFVLRRVAEILTDFVPDGDTAARIGGDEFVILLGRGRDATDGARLAETLQTEIRRDIVFEGNTCRVGASFGIASAHEGLAANKDLLVAADAALYVAKDHGRNTVVLYTPAVHAAVSEKRELAAQIERGIEREEFDAFFQPQYDARTLELAGLEALARWRHPRTGIQAPAQFLPIARQLSMIDDIDRIVYRKGLETIARLNAAGLDVPKVSFNVGVSQIENRDLLSLVKTVDIGRTAVAFEILESVLVEEQSTRFAFQIDALREQGIRIEVDDFGSGHASVVGLMQLRPDTMKLDQRLVLPVVESAEVRAIVRNMIETGQVLGISVTAEGVETPEHASILAALGCDTLQGYCFARPIDPRDLAARLRQPLQVSPLYKMLRNA